MTRKPVSVYTAVYDDEHAALADLEALERLHEEESIGKYDAAVIRMKLSEPHIVKRVDDPRIRVIPERLGHGALPSNELEKAAEELPAGISGADRVAEVALGRAFEDAVTQGVRVAQRDFTTTTDRLASELVEAFKA